MTAPEDRTEVEAAKARVQERAGLGINLVATEDALCLVAEVERLERERVDGPEVVWLAQDDEGNFGVWHDPDTARREIMCGWAAETPGTYEWVNDPDGTHEVLLRDDEPVGLRLWMAVIADAAVDARERERAARQLEDRHIDRTLALLLMRFGGAVEFSVAEMEAAPQHGEFAAMRNLATGGTRLAFQAANAAEAARDEAEAGR